MADFPFPYLFHGTLDAARVPDVLRLALGFAAPVPERARLTIQRSVPNGLGGFSNWSDVLFTTESLGEVFASIVYGDGPPGDAVALARFADEVERWVRGVHAQQPVAFFIGPAPVVPGDAWDAWSWREVPQRVLPFLERYAERHPESLQVDDDDLDSSEPMASAGRIDQSQMQALLRNFDPISLGGGAPEGQARARNLLARFGL